MGAIGAIYQRDGAPEYPDALSRMAAALRVHGPLRQNQLNMGSVGLCWAQLDNFIASDCYDKQPLTAGPLGFVFTGRLHYRSDLAGRLGIDRQRSEIMADGALAFAAWQKWGLRALDRLEGDFALICADGQAGKLYAARSPLSAPPLVYHDSPHQFAIATAPKGLFALPSIPREIDEQRIADMLVLNNEDSQRTMFRNVHNLPIGHWLQVSPESVEIRCYYRFDEVEPIRFARDSDYVEAADALLQDAVEDAMQALVTPACMVSAGLDSSSVAVYALAALERCGDRPAAPLIGYTAIPEQGWDGRAIGFNRLGDESGPVRALQAKYPGFEVNFVDCEGHSLDRDLDHLISLAETPPFGWNNLHWGMEINRRAAQAGRNVMLGGGSGNRTLSFSNRSLLPDLFVSGRWRVLHGHIGGLQVPQGLLKRYYRHVFRPLFPAALNKTINRFRGDLMHAGWSGFSAINPQFAADMQVDERARAMGWDNSYSTLRSSKQRMAVMTQGGTREMGALNRLAARTISGIEDRDPLGHRRLTEFCAAIPESQFMHRGQDRWLIRRLMADKLPREILTAPRGRQSADWHLRVTRDLPRYRAEIERMADDPDMARRFDVPRLRRLLDTWPEKTPTGTADHPDYLIAMVGMGRAISTARFINWVTGKNG